MSHTMTVCVRCFRGVLTSRTMTACVCALLQKSVVVTHTMTVCVCVASGECCHIQ